MFTLCSYYLVSICRIMLTLSNYFFNIILINYYGSTGDRLYSHTSVPFFKNLPAWISRYRFSLPIVFPTLLIRSSIYSLPSMDRVNFCLSRVLKVISMFFRRASCLFLSFLVTDSVRFYLLEH